MWDFSSTRRALFGGTDSSPERTDTSGSTSTRAATDGGQQVVIPSSQDLVLDLPEGVDPASVEGVVASEGSGNSVRIADDDDESDGYEGGSENATTPPLRIEAAAASESTVTPVASGREETLAESLFDIGSSGWSRIQDPKIQNIEDNSVRYDGQVGQWILETDDLVPGVLSRLKGLLLGAEGLTVEPTDPDDESDQRLAEHLRGIYRNRQQPAGETDGETLLHIDPAEVVDIVLAENITSGLFVGRSTDLQHLDLSTLGYARDGKTGEEVYIQEQTSYTTFEVEDDGSVEFDTERTDDERALRIGEDVLDVELYRAPPLRAIANDVVNKIQLKRLKGRKAEIASVGGLYITVRPPPWLPESDYNDRIPAEDNPLSNHSISKLELAQQQDIGSALETLQEYQMATVMSVPDHWEVSTIDLPEMDESFDDMIRGYNQAIARRLLFPLDLLELEKGSELSRDTMMQTLLNVISGWQGDLTTLFDGFARTQKDIHGMSGEVEHHFPSVGAEDEEQIVGLLNFAGLLGMTEAEARQLVNALEGVDLDPNPDRSEDGTLPPAGGPDDPTEREASMRERLGRSSPPAQAGSDDGRDGDSADAEVEAKRADPSHTFSGPDTLREASQHVRRLVEDRLNSGEGQTVEMTTFDTDHFAVLVRSRGGQIANSMLVRRSPAHEGADEWSVVGDTSKEFFRPRRPLLNAAGNESGTGAEEEGEAGGGWLGPHERLLLVNSLETANAVADRGDLPPDVWGVIPVPEGLLEAGAADTATAIGAETLDIWAEWKPVLHPRGPDGRFVGRPFSIPDAVLENLDDLTNQDIIDHPDVHIPDDAGINITPGAFDDDPLGKEPGESGAKLTVERVLDLPAPGESGGDSAGLRRDDWAPYAEADTGELKRLVSDLKNRRDAKSTDGTQEWYRHEKRIRYLSTLLWYRDDAQPRYADMTHIESRRGDVSEGQLKQRLQATLESLDPHVGAALLADLPQGIQSGGTPTEAIGAYDGATAYINKDDTTTMPHELGHSLMGTMGMLDLNPHNQNKKPYLTHLSEYEFYTEFEGPKGGEEEAFYDRIRAEWDRVTAEEADFIRPYGLTNGDEYLAVAFATWVAAPEYVRKIHPELADVLDDYLAPEDVQ